MTNQLYLHGGIEKIVSQKINYWIEHYGYDVLLCTTEQHSKSFIYTLDSRLKHVDLKINYFRDKSYFHPKNVLKSFTHFKRLKKLVKEEQPDIIISVNYTPEQYLLPFTTNNIPIVKEMHSSGYLLHKKNKGIRNRLFNLFGKYNALVVLNKDEKEFYPFNNIKVIPNFIQVHKEPQDKNKENTILAAGRIAPVKQFEHLITVWSILFKQFPDWNLKIFGEGDPNYVTQLKNAIMESGMNNIHILPSTNQLNKEMEKASVYAMTSATECFPMVLLEAMDAEMALISYNCPTGPANIIEHNRNGVLIAQDDTNAFATGLSLLLKGNDLRTRLGQNAKNDIVLYSEQQVMKKWNKLFHELIEKQ